MLFDAVFESYPPFHETRKILQDLETSFGRAEDSHGLRADGQALDGYLREREISERHVHFASLALRVYEAARVAVSRLVISSGAWSKITEGIGMAFSPDLPGRPGSRQSSHSRHAAFVGFNLKMDCEPLGEDWQTQGLERQASPWLCSAHGEVREPGYVPDTLGALTFFAFDIRNLARLCARHSLESGCDVSRVDFDMADIGFRMTVTSLSGVNGPSGIFGVTMVRAGTTEL